MKNLEALLLLAGGALLPWTTSAAPAATHFVQTRDEAQHGPATTYAECQRKTCRPLDGCPPNTLFVSKTSRNANFTSIQAAILSIANDDEPATILIAPGEYTEQLNVTRQAPLTLLGMTDRPYGHELYADIDVNSDPRNEVRVWWNVSNANGRFNDNLFAGVLTVGPTQDATLTGSGPTGWPVPADTPFGCKDFRVYNMDFRNEEHPRSSGPAHAVGVSRANAGFYSCGLYSFQDTLYVGKLGNAYFYDNVIAGQTDFLYGFGTAFVEKSTLSLRNCGGGITAWKGTNTTFENKYGVYVSDSQVIAANASIAETIRGRCPLGRPWNNMHRSIFMDSYFDESILPTGYIRWGTANNGNMGPKTFMAVHDNFGPGWNPEALASNSEVTIVLDDKGIEPYDDPLDVFLTEDGQPGNVGWIDQTVYPA